MQIGIDTTGKVWLASDSVPSDWNGMSLTVVNLTADQGQALKTIQNSDPASITFDGSGFTFTPRVAAQPIDLSNVDNLEKTLKAMGLLMRDYCNSLKAGTYTTKTVADLKADFSAKYNSLQ